MNSIERHIQNLFSDWVRLAEDIALYGECEDTYYLKKAHDRANAVALFYEQINQHKEITK